jgi:hypothetical protein
VRSGLRRGKPEAGHDQRRAKQRGDGLSAAQALREHLPSCRVVTVTTFGRSSYCAELVAAIRRVMVNERVVDPELVLDAYRPFRRHRCVSHWGWETTARKSWSFECPPTQRASNCTIGIVRFLNGRSASFFDVLRLSRCTCNEPWFLIYMLLFIGQSRPSGEDETLKRHMRECGTV